MLWSKKQNVIYQSSTEAKNRAMSQYRVKAQLVCEVMWLYQWLNEVGLKSSLPGWLWCDYQVVHIASNSMFHE